ncbi:MAG: cysteine--tRNA ligase [Patescibacteria group bacterium]
MEFAIKNPQIYLYNTLARQKEIFEPIKHGEVKMYVCGPTVYHYAHIGNLRAYVFADTLRRMLEFNGLRVKQVMNITDVGHLSSDSDSGEDKLEKGAKREGKTVWEVAKFYTTQFLDDLKLLNIETPAVMPKATDHIKEMISLIHLLEKKELTYTADGNVYFDTSKFDHYGLLSGSKVATEQTESRVEIDPNKKHPADFVLWFTRYKYLDHAMMWDSPWGKGFPGWHIECSAMATKYLGEHIDIHTGGVDHIAVHHTNEIAQSEGAFGHKWVNVWMHNDFLQVQDGVKMAKSDDNFLRLQSIIDKGYDPLDYRYYLLGGHYRTKMNFSFAAMDGAKNSLARLKNQIAEIKKDDSKTSNLENQTKYLDRFAAAVNQDLNTAVALAVLWEAVGDAALSKSDKIDLISRFDQVFGLDLLADKVGQIPADVEALVSQRDKARADKDWARSDELRGQIAKLGYSVLDEKSGPKVEKL